MVVAMINETAPALAADIRGEGRPRLWDLLDEWMALDETRAPAPPARDHREEVRPLPGVP